jgi:hypothetical protein
MLSSEQRGRYLREMGYQPLRLRGAGSAPVAALSVQPTRSGSVAGTPATTPPPTPTACHAGVADPLVRALLGAAGAATAQPAELGWEERLTGPAFDFDGPTLRINPIALRQQPAAKRALWKTLRSLRARRLHGP